MRPRWKHGLASVALLAAAALAQGALDGTVSQPAQQVLFTGSGSRGVFDPALTEDAATGRLWMSYSSFDVSAHSRWGIELRLAYSDDGENWHDAGPVQTFMDVAVGPLAANEAGEPEVPPASRGTWQNETSTLVYDDQAPREQRWKLFWHQSLWVDDIPRYASYSWIAMKASDAPENLAHAAPIKLFTGYLAKTTGESAAAPAFSPLPSAPAIHLDRRDAQLGACIFGQPAALAARDGLYLALDCAWLGTRPQLHTVLLRCTSPSCQVTDAASWTVVGRLTEPRDAQRLDERYKGFGGTSLAEKDGRYYLLATPVTTDGDRYDGCNVFRFADLAYGKLERSRRGKLIPASSVHGIPETHHGACATHARLKGGILLSQVVSTAAPRILQIRHSGTQLR